MRNEIIQVILLEVSNKKASILFVDDEHLICDIFTEYFDLEGYQTHKAFSGQEAFQFLCENQDEIDIVVTDIKMNNGDGLWLIKQINQANIKKHVFIMTAHLEFKLDELEHMGVKYVFHKPAKFDDVLAKIESFI